MAAFASCRRSGWVRVLVVILCALFIFATIGAPPAHALAVESVAVFGLASVLSAATAALGFKLASNEQGQATLQKMVQDFKTVAWATGFVLVGSKLNGLQNGMDYIKMQVKEGKTYLDARVFAWVQQWLAQNGVYDSGSFVPFLNSDYSVFDTGVRYSFTDLTFVNPLSISLFSQYITTWSNYNAYDWTSAVVFFDNTFGYSSDFLPNFFCVFGNSLKPHSIDLTRYDSYIRIHYNFNSSDTFISAIYFHSGLYESYTTVSSSSSKDYSLNHSFISYYTASNIGSLSSNQTGLSGTDTLGKDVIDLTLDQILQKLKEWAQDWFDAGADSATNAATGAQDLPLTVATGAATANPSIAEDGPLVWFPSFGLPIPKLRTGETDTKTVDQGKENASAAETSTVDVAENQSVINSLVNWALNYISPDTGLFSKFPLCVPYDAYLLVTSSLGVDAVGSDSIFGASPGDLEGVVSQDIDTYSDFQPIINIKHDFELDGKTYPVELTIDLTPWQPFVTFFREGMALLLIAELIGSEFKRIRGH